MKRPSDIWLRIVIIPAIILITNLVFFYEPNFSGLAYLIWSLIGIINAWLIWEISMQWALYVRHWFTDIRRTRLRVIITFLGYFAITALMQALLVLMADLTHTNSVPITQSLYIKQILVGIFIVFVIGSVFEVVYYIQKYREAIQESEAMKKAGLQSQYNNLKNQVNPHFLFNSLNSLSALISENPKQAVLFLDELSSVYRYLLQAGQRSLVTVADEMNFLRAYRYLIDTRFGNSLQWNIRVEEKILECSIPPLTFQTLIENALRHNSLLSEKTFTIQIETPEPGVLVVRNDINRKRAIQITPQGGLAWLALRYDSLGLPAPVIEDDGKQFVVRLSLLCKEQLPEIQSETTLNTTNL